MTHVLLNNVDHHDLRVVTRRDPEFGDAVNQVMVFPTEFEAVQREYPIVLRESAEGALRPVALLGLARDENLFLDGEGGWRARYVPALMERGPFAIAAPEGETGDPMICIDVDDARVSRERGTPVFLPHGGNSPYLEHVQQVLRAIYAGHALLDPLIAALEAAELLQPVKLEAKVAEGEIYAVSKVFTVDRERLATLGAPELAALNRQGFLQSAFFIAASLGNFQRLVDLKRSTRGEASG